MKKNIYIALAVAMMGFTAALRIRSIISIRTPIIQLQR